MTLVNLANHRIRRKQVLGGLIREYHITAFHPAFGTGKAGHRPNRISEPHTIPWWNDRICASASTPMIKQETSTQLPDRESRLSPRDHLFEDLNRRLERLVRRVDNMQPRQVQRQVTISDLANSDWDHGDTNTLGVADLL